ncbi:ubiquitin carboxyl-terminal hydrolase MINDY-3 homolog [Drosophila gunungcola]|uniref:ubiquitin carboxyl-terminal hydrolase MINDY-3 homolog n=1 Tax=Drosophila gunungcola TaxID=103775 RepID=UPI0022DF63E9|nr:ubiquitin carboxyl-terminal hydrolase MINDY-3 homolog [Drosophila gunungcola]
MNEEIVRERSGGEESSVVSPKTASSAAAAAAAAAASMTLASAALESHTTASANVSSTPPGSASPTTSGAGAAAGGGGGGGGASGGGGAEGAGGAVASASGGLLQEKLPLQLQLNATDMRELREIKQLLWGDNVREDVFKRWSQGFEFSKVEPSALVQKQGGPCAVIAPVQAYLLKIIIMDMPGVKLSEISYDKCQNLLIQALCNILKNCRAPRYRIVHLMRRRGNATEAGSTKERSPGVEGGSAPAGPAGSSEAAAGAQVELAAEATPASVNEMSLEQLDNDPHRELSPDEFHERLHTLHFEDIATVARYYMENYGQLAHTYGVLLFMYSVFLTKGSELVAADISDTSEPLIHSTYGYGAQSLINLMLTGRAVAHVWDNEQDVGGLKLRGICEQSDIGFITLMEQMRYCTVGSFFKNPRYPVWVMGSDTHLTVLFSNEKRLVSPETPSEIGRRIFKSYDPEGNNFISTTMLREVLAALNLVSEPAYVGLMQKRLDPENLGIILLNAFMDEFFPLERRSTPDTFELMHYNGIPGSNENNRVRYYCGSAILLEGDLKSICTSNPMVTCLQTKWPNIEINWHDVHMPSLN